MCAIRAAFFAKNILKLNILFSLRICVLVHTLRRLPLQQRFVRQSSERVCPRDVMNVLPSVMRSAIRSAMCSYERVSCWGGVKEIPVLARGARGLKPGKGHRGARARFSRAESFEDLVKYGPFIRGRAGKRHHAEQKTNRRLTRLSSPAGVSRSDLPRLRKLLRF